MQSYLCVDHLVQRPGKCKFLLNTCTFFYPCMVLRPRMHRRQIQSLRGFCLFFCYLAPHKCVEHSYLSVNSVTPSFIPFNTWQEVEYSFAPYIAYITPTTITQNGTNRLASVNPQPSSCDMTEATCSPPWLCTT